MESKEAPLFTDPGRHLDDLDIIREADGELPSHRARQVRHHLAACWSCRTRKTELDRGVADFVQVYRRQFDQRIPSIDGPRKRLVTHLEESHRTAEPMLWWRILFASRTMWSAFATAVVALVVAATFFHQQRLPLFQDLQRPLSSLPLPDRAISPGVSSVLTPSQVCSMQAVETGDVDEKLAHRVFERYGMVHPAPGAYEVDYVVPLALGGSQSAENLWPQPYSEGEWNSHIKDALEQHLESLVCSGKLDIRQAQAALSSNWIQAYRSYFNSAKPLPDHLAFMKDRPWYFSKEILGN